MNRGLYAWLLAMRLRTLPLACSSVLLGAGLAASHDVFDMGILALALLTAVLLQILSNLANDYGDAVSGADGEGRSGPARTVMAGLIAPRRMLVAIVLTALMAAVSGLALLYVSFGADWPRMLAFTLLGGVAIVAAITYTVGMGCTPYGYRGFGDISVFLFFGLLGVLGAYYLFAHELAWILLLPAAACGLLATAVLNINNIRDIASDSASGKITLAVRLGRPRAIVYHWALLMTASMLTLVFLAMRGANGWSWLFLVALKPLVDAARTLSESSDGEILTAMLKKTVIGTLLYSVLLSIGLVLS
ncbi:1,4-dihydroxy-2-naphthoate octaprenyltransferase [Billgrantia endophytica]|uniref:1,4-dihydroxy-2-naphthoate octaprenyltransferase n=2 Tax=Billgrantia endophytica TaxID=2033802 RepID=A0A2N7U3V2_9GAMM|nr:1,4-dihydroxy-2-naphthoate octaprenyltransferase [Halomonas endophytica]PMR75099.1 1,4-dihydroxy-2-naphthoate octaprenyltransferase [Halomonas endophytica]